MTLSQVEDVIAWNEQATKLRVLLNEQKDHLVFIGNSSGTYKPAPVQRQQVHELLTSFLNSYEQALEKM